MFFLIRCVFWLTVVYSTIFSNQNPVAPHPQSEPVHQAAVMPAARQPDDSAERLGRTMQDWVTAALQSFWNKATGRCDTDPTKCVALAERLAAFAREHDGAASVAADADTDAQVATGHGSAGMRLAERTVAPVSPPLPPLRPQRGLGHASAAHAGKHSGRS